MMPVVSKFNLLGIEAGNDRKESIRMKKRPPITEINLADDNNESSLELGKRSSKYSKNGLEMSQLNDI